MGILYLGRAGRSRGKAGRLAVGGDYVSSRTLVRLPFSPLPLSTRPPPSALVNLANAVRG